MLFSRNLLCAGIILISHGAYAMQSEKKPDNVLRKSSSKCEECSGSGLLVGWGKVTDEDGTSFYFNYDNDLENTYRYDYVCKTCKLCKPSNSEECRSCGKTEWTDNRPSCEACKGTGIKHVKCKSCEGTGYEDQGHVTWARREGMTWVKEDPSERQEHEKCTNCNGTGTEISVSELCKIAAAPRSESNEPTSSSSDGMQGAIMPGNVLRKSSSDVKDRLDFVPPANKADDEQVIPNDRDYFEESARRRSRMIDILQDGLSTNQLRKLLMLEFMK